MNNLFDQAIHTMESTNVWPQSHKVELATIHDRRAILRNDDCNIRLYIVGYGEISPGFTIGWLDLAANAWKVAQEATLENYEAWVERVKDKLGPNDQPLRLAKVVHKRFPHLKTRAYRAAAIVRAGAVKQVGVNLFEVTSQSNSAGTYRVDSEAGTCTCPDWPKAPKVSDRQMCKHRIAVLMTYQMEEAQVSAETQASSSPTPPYPSPHSITPRRKAQLQDLQHRAALAGQPMVLAP